MDDHDETPLPFPRFIAVAAADVREPPAPTFSEKENGRIWDTVADSYANCSIFPPNLHEGLHLRSDLHQTLALPHIPQHQRDAAAALYFPKREKGEEDSARVSEPSLISAQRMLSSWLNLVRSKISDRFGGIAEIGCVGVCTFVAMAGFVIYLRRRHRREKEFLLFSIQEKNQGNSGISWDFRLNLQRERMPPRQGYEGRITASLYIVGGHIAEDYRDEGNLFTIPSNKYAEFNMYLDPLAAKTVFESDLEITLIPLHAQRQATSFPTILKNLQLVGKTPELEFCEQLLSLLHRLQQDHQVYNHMDIFLGEILGAVFLAGQPYLDSQIQVKPINVMVGDLTTDGQLFIDEKNGKAVNILDNINSEAFYIQFAKYLSEINQTAVIGSFEQQKKQWSSPPNRTSGAHSK